MKNIIIILCSGILALLINISLSGQNSILVLKKKSNGKEIHFQQDTNLEMLCKNGQYFNGQFKIVNNDSIRCIIDKYRQSIQISLDDIAEIKTDAPITNIFGEILTGGGVTGTLMGLGAILIASEQGYANGNPGLGLLIGSVLIGVGMITFIPGINLMSAHRHYKYTKWKYYVKTN